MQRAGWDLYCKRDLTYLFELLGFVLGLLFGSFLNVCISRLPAHESIVKPRSHCMACGHPIRWFDNLPVLSWIVLRGRCRDCKARISWRYPAIELAVGLWILGIVRHIPIPAIPAGNLGFFGFFLIILFAPALLIHLLALAILGFLLIGLMVMDWQTQRLPDAFTLTGIAIGFALTCVQAIFHLPNESPSTLILGRIAAIAGAAMVLLTVRWGYKALRKRDGMGLGDVKLLAMIAAFLGFGQTLLALFAGVADGQRLRHRSDGAPAGRRRHQTPAGQLPRRRRTLRGPLWAANHCLVHGAVAVSVL